MTAGIPACGLPECNLIENEGIGRERSKKNAVKKKPFPDGIGLGAFYL